MTVFCRWLSRVHFAFFCLTASNSFSRREDLSVQSLLLCWMLQTVTRSNLVRVKTMVLREGVVLVSQRSTVRASQPLDPHNFPFFCNVFVISHSTCDPTMLRRTLSKRPMTAIRSLSSAAASASSKSSSDRFLGMTKRTQRIWFSDPAVVS
jgi:hypothetical protein